MQDTKEKEITTGEFKVGDVVVLKSLSPKMTICGVDNHMVDCMWFTSDEIIRTGRFRGATLTKVTFSPSA